MTDETPEISEDLDSRADFVMGLLSSEKVREPNGRFASTQADAGEGEPAEQNSADEVEAAPGDPASGEDAEPTTEQVETPAIVLPPGWSAEKADAFKLIPPDVREYIAAREIERNKHFDRTAQEAATERKAAEAERQAVSAERQRYAQALGGLMQQIQQTAPKPPSPELARTDPAKYIAEKAAFDDAAGRYQAAHAEMQRVQDEESENQTRAFRDHLTNQGKILDEKIPEWRDEKKRAKDQQDIATFLRDTGYGQEEIAAVADARAVQIARKAMLYDRLMAQNPAAKKAPPTPAPTLRPGPASTTSTPNAKLAALKKQALATDDLRARADFALAALNQR